MTRARSLRFEVVCLVALVLASLASVFLSPAAAAPAPPLTLRADAGVAAVPTGVTQTKFPLPVQQRDPVACNFLLFDVVEAGDLAPRTAGAAPVVATWTSHKGAVRADTIVRVDEETDGRVRLWLSTYSATEAPSLLVAGKFSEIQAIVAQSQGVRVVAVTYDGK